MIRDLERELEFLNGLAKPTAKDLFERSGASFKKKKKCCLRCDGEPENLSEWRGMSEKCREKKK